MSFEATPVDLEIQTLLQAGQGSHLVNESVSNVIQPKFYKSSRRSIYKTSEAWCSKRGQHFQRQHSSDSESSQSSSDVSEQERVVVNGADIGDLPTQYTVIGLQRNEIPVIGTYVDKRVVPGFKYKVRKIGEKACMFDGRALTLQSIGMGYGKRITMEGDNLNFNDNYFYSDTHPEGYGFSLLALVSGDQFTVYNDERHAVGSASIGRVVSQKELSSVTTDNGDVEKTVWVVFRCDLRYTGEGNCVPMLSTQSSELQAILVIIKPKRSRKADVKYIPEITLEHLGACSFEMA